MSKHSKKRHFRKRTKKSKRYLKRKRIVSKRKFFSRVRSAVIAVGDKKYTQTITSYDYQLNGTYGAPNNYTNGAFLIGLSSHNTGGDARYALSYPVPNASTNVTETRSFGFLAKKQIYRLLIWNTADISITNAYFGRPIIGVRIVIFRPRDRTTAITPGRYNDWFAANTATSYLPAFWHEEWVPGTY